MPAHLILRMNKHGASPRSGPLHYTVKAGSDIFDNAGTPSRPPTRNVMPTFPRRDKQPTLQLGATNAESSVNPIAAFTFDPVARPLTVRAHLSPSIRLGSGIIFGNPGNHN